MRVSQIKKSFKNWRHAHYDRVAGSKGTFQRARNVAGGLSLSYGLGSTVYKGIKKAIPKETVKAKGYKRHLLNNLASGNINTSNLSSIDKATVRKLMTKKAGLRKYVRGMSKHYKSEISNLKGGKPNLLNPVFSLFSTASIPSTIRSTVNKYRL